LRTFELEERELDPREKPLGNTHFLLTVYSDPFVDPGPSSIAPKGSSEARVI